MQRLEGGRILANLEIHETDVSSSADSANLSELPTVGTTVTARFVTFPRFNTKSCVIVFFCCRQGCCFSGISGNLEMSGNLAKFGEKA